MQGFYNYMFIFESHSTIYFGVFKSQKSFTSWACKTLVSIIWISFYLDFHRQWYSKLSTRELMNLQITRTKWKATMQKRALNIGSVIIINQFGSEIFCNRLLFILEKFSWNNRIQLVRPCMLDSDVRFSLWDSFKEPWHQNAASGENE